MHYISEFQVNSSSTHAFIFVTESELAEIQDDLCGGADQFYFGWQHFTLKSSEMKKKYLAIMLRDNLKTIPESLVWAICKVLMGDEPFQNYEHFCEGYIDHQSEVNLPKRRKTYDSSDKFDDEFLKEFIRFVNNRNVVIIGGSDNDYEDDRHPLKLSPHDQPTIIGFLQHRESSCVIKDPKGFWILFNRASGEKLLFSFEDPTMSTFKPTYPIFMDIKLSDYCPIECRFCAESCTKDGNRTNLGIVRKMTYALKETNVLEVALGGGELTYDPNLMSILQQFDLFGITTNLTTANYQCLYDPQLRKHFSSCNTGKIAFSIRTIMDLNALGDILKETEFPKEKAIVQVVLGTLFQHDFHNIVNSCAHRRLSLSVLGFKSKGRGVGFKTSDEFQPYPWWIETIRKAGDSRELPYTMIDTNLYHEFKDELKKYGFVQASGDGQFSCYYDATTKKLARSSVDMDTAVDFDFSTDTDGTRKKLREIFAMW